MKNEPVCRQGDLVFFKTDDQLSGTNIKELLVAHGENGHNHVLVAEAGSTIRGDKTKFTLTGKAKLVHPEHDTIPFSSGTYVVLTEREHDYINNELVKVRD